MKPKEADECLRHVQNPLTEHAKELGANHAGQGLQRHRLAGQQTLTGTSCPLLCYTLCCWILQVSRPGSHDRHLDEGSELRQQGEGVVGHGVDLGAVPIARLAAAGGGAHLRPTPVIG